MEKTLNVGLVGYGLAGRVFHAPIIESVDGLKLYKVYETKDKNIKHMNAVFPEAIAVSDTEEIFNDKKVDIVVLAVVNTLHCSLAKKAIEHGKHVVLEKPFTITSKEADELISLAKEKGVLLTVNHNRRWDSDFLTVKKIKESGVLGDIVHYEAHFDRYRVDPKSGTWRESNLPGSGMLYDLGSHIINQAQCLFGNPIEVLGDIRVQREKAEIADEFTLLLNYGKFMVTLKSSMLVRELGPHYVMNGTKGSFVKYGMDVQEENLKAGAIPRNYEDWGKEPESIWGTLNAEMNGVNFRGKVESETGDYRKLYENLYRAVTQGEKLAVDPLEARDTIRIIELAEQSSCERRWVKL